MNTRTAATPPAADGLGVKPLINAFWRAAAYCLHPKVIALSLLPLVLGAGAAVGLGWYFWEPAVAAVRSGLEQWALVETGLKLVDGWFGPSFRTMLAPLLVVLAAVPVIVVLSVLLVAVLMVPAIVNLVSGRRFGSLERKRGASFFTSAAWSLWCTVLAMLGLLVSLPFWFVPPLVMIIPPLIWGWLTFKVMAFDVLSEHASAEERRELMRRHHLPLLCIGVVAGYLGAAPSLVWALGAFTLVFAPVLIGVSVWLYTLVFAFSALWFAHYLLAALTALRAERAAKADFVVTTATPANTAQPTAQVIELRPHNADSAPPAPSAALPPPP